MSFGPIKHLSLGTVSEGLRAAVLLNGLSLLHQPVSECYTRGYFSTCSHLHSSPPPPLQMRE
jgi:hypothetical protein